MLRDGALSDRRVIALINQNFVPLWVNVRKEPVPYFPEVESVLIEASFDEDRRIDNLFSQGFFVRSLVLDPNDHKLLNPQSETVHGSAGTMLTEGHFAYAEYTGDQYLKMLERSLSTYCERMGCLLDPADEPSPASADAGF